MYESPLVARNYSKYRPTYPQILWDKIFAFAEKHGTGSKMALDLACGTGLSTFGLCSHYQRTVGVDVSKAQLDYAKEKMNDRPEKYDNVEFILSTATLPEISGHGPIFSVYSSVYAIVEVNGRRWELGIKHRR